MKHYSAARAVISAQCIILLLALVGNAGEGSLTGETIDRFRSSFDMDPHTRATYNAITNNDINSLALNRELLSNHNTLFGHKIETKGITNQKSSGRCWLFSSLNMLRPLVIKKNNLDGFEFSQNYLAFWDKMEKANCFLEYIIEFRDRDPLDRELQLILEHPYSDGGYWDYVVALIRKYGAVPKDAMPETNNSGKTGIMNKVISRKLRQSAAILRKMHQAGKSLPELQAEKEKILAEIYRMLMFNLGEPPADFAWRYEDKDSLLSELKTYTPRSFYDEFIGIDLGQYVNLFDNPTKEYRRHYQCALSRNMYDGEDVHYASIEVDKLKEIAMKSILADDPVVFSCDVGKDQYGKAGIMALDIFDYGSLFNTDLTMTKRERALYFESSSDHMMVLIGVDTVDGKPVKWLVENSWGDERGDKGYWTLYNDWFDMYVYDITVKREYVPEEILQIFDQKPIVLPPWDPMSRMVRR
ncbi:MAG: C1 family peptidase [Candidatus Zixiibacteriota bacterium]|nr:MAG: C1 family peptidase [candidate division Zixibacteria bacterium]